MEVLELKNTISKKLFKSLSEFNNRMEVAEKRGSKLEDET